jgi:hypothetical protein
MLAMTISHKSSRISHKLELAYEKTEFIRNVVIINTWKVGLIVEIFYFVCFWIENEYRESELNFILISNLSGILNYMYLFRQRKLSHN